MVTSNKLPDKKVVKMSEQNTSIVVPQRTLLGEVNEHITCPLCRGYYIDATTIVECLHSFCRSCIIKHLQAKSYCPVCEMMINSAKPNIKLDKALQDIVYKLVPGLFQKEMERRQQFYASRPGSAASATPEQRGEDTERIIFSPEDVISFSLEYADATDADSISSKSSDSNEPQSSPAIARRYLQCPAVVNISHLKKFLCMKFDIDSSQFAIDILYKRVPLPDYYTLMDIAYIYNWKRNEPMRFFYQIIDYVAIRNRLFDITRKTSQFPDRKPSPTLTEDTSVSSPVPNLNDNCSEEVSSGTDSPMPTDNLSKNVSETKKNEKSDHDLKDNTISNNMSTSKKSDDEVEKSQFLNSFELTAKNNTSVKSSPTKQSPSDSNICQSEPETKSAISAPKLNDPIKRKQPSISNAQDMKKLRVELDKSKISTTIHTAPSTSTNHNTTSTKCQEKVENPKEEIVLKEETLAPISTSSLSAITTDTKETSFSNIQQAPESPATKRPVSGPTSMSSAKRKMVIEPPKPQPAQPLLRTVSPLKLQIPKFESQQQTSKPSDVPKPVKKVPDLKPSMPATHTLQNKSQSLSKVRMDLLANNSDPTIDRSKIMSQVKSSLGLQQAAQTSGDPLKSLFDSCKINIPSSLSITLTDQKDQRNPNEPSNNSNDPKVNIMNKNLAQSNVSTHKVPSPPVHNYIEILKLPDNDPKKPTKPENSSDIKPISGNKPEPLTKPQIKSESSAKGPIPNLKPIDPKPSKQSGNFGGPITFQQTFEQQLQSLQSDKKTKPPKSKTQMPKLVPANPKNFNASKLNVPQLKPTQPNLMPIASESKPSTALDLSTPQSNLSPHQTKTLETMQTIANLAKKQNMSPKVTTPTSVNLTSNLNRPMSTVGALRLPPSNLSQTKFDKPGPSGAQGQSSMKQEPSNKQAAQAKAPSNPSLTIQSYSNYQISALSSPSTAQSSPRSQTRSPSSSPKLVIAEEKQVVNACDLNVNQSNQVTSTQVFNMNTNKSESPKAVPGPSSIKPGLKSIKPIPAVNKIPSIRQLSAPNVKPSPSHGLHLFSANQELLRQQLDMSAAWLSAQNTFNNMYKNISNMARQSQNDFNKDKQ